MSRKVAIYVFHAFVSAVVLVSLLVVLLPPSIAEADGPYFSDNFDDNALNSSLWVATEQGGPTVAETNHRLEVTIPAGSQDPPINPLRGFRAGYTSTSPVRGDFDVQVDFELLTWPSDDGVRVGIIMDEDPYAWDNVQWVNMSRCSNYQSWSEFYATLLSGQSVQATATNDLAGKLRQIRLGDTISAYYWDISLSDWVLLYTWSGAPTTDLYVSILAWSSDSFFGDQDALVAFDNLAVSSPGPNQPANVLPISGASGVSVTPILQSSPFSDPDAGDTHAASQWQVRTSSGSYSTPDYDSGTDDLHVTSITMPSGRLNYSTTYCWHVRYQDNHGAWSDWSSETSFTVAGRSPNQPSNIVPPTAATRVSLTPTLQSSPFADPDSGNLHSASQWQVRETSGSYSSPIYNSGTDNTNLTITSIPSGLLSHSTTYCWHARYQDNTGLWSDWSAETFFTTAKDGLPFWIWIIVGVAAVFVVSVGAYLIGRRRVGKQ